MLWQICPFQSCLPEPRCNGLLPEKTLQILPTPCLLTVCFAGPQSWKQWWQLVTPQRGHMHLVKTVCPTHAQLVEQPQRPWSQEQWLTPCGKPPVPTTCGYYVPCLCVLCGLAPVSAVEAHSLWQRTSALLKVLALPTTFKNMRRS